MEVGFVLFLVAMVVIYYTTKLGKHIIKVEENKNDAMLRGMTVGDLLDSKLFRKELQWQVDNEIESHDRMAREAFTMGMRLQRSPHQRLRDKEMFDVDSLVEAYKLIICKNMNSTLSSAEREYVKQVVMMAYWRTVDRLKKKEDNE